MVLRLLSSSFSLLQGDEVVFRGKDSRRKNTRYVRHKKKRKVNNSVRRFRHKNLKKTRPVIYLDDRANTSALTRRHRTAKKTPGVCSRGVFFFFFFLPAALHSAAGIRSFVDDADNGALDR